MENTDKNSVISNNDEFTTVVDICEQNSSEKVVEPEGPSMAETAVSVKDGDAPVFDKIKNLFKSKKSRYIAAGCALVVALSVCGMTACATTQPGNSTPSTGGTTVAPTETSKISLQVNASSWDDKSTPVIAHIVGKDNKVDVYHAFKANTKETLEFDKGEYSVTYISPINSDGSIYDVPTTSKSVKTQEAAEKTIVPDQTTITRIPADQVTQEQVDKIIENIGEAIKKGDDSLSAEQGKEILNNAATNAAAAPNVNKDAVDEKTDTTIKDTASTENKDNTPATDSGTNGSTDSGSNNSGTSGGESTNNGGSTNSGNNTQTAPAHEHSWVAQTSQVWVPNMVTVTDSAGWDESVPVYGTKSCSICNTCGADITGNTAAHQKTHALAGEQGSYSIKDVQVITGYETVHHDAVTHTEDQGHYETTTSGYACSSCGATK